MTSIGVKQIENQTLISNMSPKFKKEQIQHNTDTDLLTSESDTSLCYMQGE